MVIGNPLTLGGGGGGEAFAAIEVSYPEGAICTCSTGTVTLKAKDTSGKWLFLLPSGGVWTVEITKDGFTPRSITVTPEENTVIKLVIGFELVIFRNGDNPEVTGGWTKVGTTGEITGGTLTITDERLAFLADSTSSRRGACTVLPIPLHTYSTLYARVSLGASPATFDNYRIGIVNKKACTDTDFVAFANLSRSVATVTIPLSGLDPNGEYYICITSRATGGPSYLYECWAD